MAERIYIRNANGELEPLVEERFETEELLQELIGQHPELLGGDQIRPADPLRWILIRREMPVEGWAVDHLLIDQDARPTLVEVKRGSNREIRRNIVGQMLDYAATASGVWSGGGLRSAFEQDSVKRDADPVIELRKLLKPDDDTEPDEEADLEDLIDEFWDRAATNLDANRLRLLFVADEIPAELERVVKFLNEQTRDNLEVLAVEVKQYPGKFGDALVSRVIGQAEANLNTRRPDARRASIREEVLERCTPSGRSALESLIDTVEKSGAYAAWGKNGLTISKYNSLSGRWPYVARFNWWPDDDAPLSLVMRRPEIYPLPPTLREALQRWIDKFDVDDFVVPFNNLQRYDIGWAVTERDFVTHADLITSRLMDTLDEIGALSSSAP